MFPVRIPQIALLLVAAAAPVAAVTINQFNLTLTEDFNTLASTGTSSTLPTGWSLLETGSAANTTYTAGTAGTGSSTTGDTYSFGAAASSDRALGTLQSGALIATIGTVVTNTTGGTITSLTISYTGEQWRLGAQGRTDHLDFQFSMDATGIGPSGTWTDANQLDFVAPNTTATVGALDGNAAANRTVITFTLTGLNLSNGTSLWLRWNDFNATGSDDGLAIDDFSISAPGAVPQNAPDGLSLVGATTLLGALLLAGTRRVLRG